MGEEANSIKTISTFVRPKVASWDDLSVEQLHRLTTTEGWVTVEGTHGKWLNFPLIAGGKATPAALKLCPKSAELSLQSGFLYGGFSTLLPGGIITPHTDEPASNTDTGKMTHHLGLCVPSGCYFIYKNNAHEEVNGQMFCFDCTNTHSAVNMSEEPRTILYFAFA